MKDNEGKIVRKMNKILRKLRRGCVEKRVVRACLFWSVKGRHLYHPMKNINEIRKMIEDGHEQENSEQDGEGDNGEAEQGSEKKQE